jgi:Tfp pilus assembly protein PilN
VITRLNLASNPFRNRTLPWTVAVVVSAVSLLALIFILAQYRDESAKAAAAETQVATMTAERDRLLKHADEIRQNIPPEQLKTLDAAHALVSRKSFSWSQLFSDLEEVLPLNVRVSRINVRDVAQFGDQTRAELDLTVVGKTPADVTDMMEKMNHAGTFSATPVTENQKSGRGETGYEWVLRVNYVQRARRRAERSSDEVGAASAPEGVVASREDKSEVGGRE